jgi:hypothetical protein
VKYFSYPLTGCNKKSELEDDHYIAADICYDVALYLYDDGRLFDARDYAYAAQRKYQSFGDRAMLKLQRTWKLMGMIEQTIRPQGGLQP